MKTVRWQPVVTEPEEAKLKELMITCGIRTKQGLFDEFAALYQWAVGEKKSGRVIASVSPTETQNGFRQFETPALSRVKPNP